MTEKQRFGPIHTDMTIAALSLFFREFAAVMMFIALLWTGYVMIG